MDESICLTLARQFANPAEKPLRNSGCFAVGVEKLQTFGAGRNSKSMNETYTVADQIADYLAYASVPACFQLSGGMIAFLADAVHQKGATPLFNLKHEQAAGFAAEGASRVAGIPSVVLATSGPGATNLVTPIASCFFDSSPVIFITGQVHSNEIKQSQNQRQNGFQELDIAGLVTPLVKYSAKISDPSEVLFTLREAWSQAVRGRPGPVLIDIPIDVQQMEAVGHVSGAPRLAQQVQNIGRESFQEDLQRLKEMLAGSKRPLILAGGGLRLADCLGSFRRFVKEASIPVVWSLMAKDCLPTRESLNFGMIGSYGNRCANRAVAQSDFLLVLGSRLDVRQTGASVEDFHRGRKIFRVDVDEAELVGRIRADHSVEADLSDFMDAMLASGIFHDSAAQVQEFQTCAVDNPIDQEQEISPELSPARIMADIGELEMGTENFIIDVGQHQMWAAQSLDISNRQRFITSGGLGAMGFSIPAAIGVAAVTESRVAVIAGDGCAQISTAELETLRYLDLDVTIYILNNNQHGMVAQFQEENLSSSYVGTRDGYSAPNFAKLSEAYGVRAIRITDAFEMQEFKSSASNLQTGPALVEILVDQGLKALPKLGGQTSLYDL
jgi:acetolactate synthase-1/2/3 large subunit